MCGTEHTCYTEVHTIYRNGVLRQIIGADGEEIHMAGKNIGHHGGTGHLYHNTHAHVLIIRLPSFAELTATLLQQLMHLIHLCNTGNHGEHDTDFTVSRGS